MNKKIRNGKKLKMQNHLRLNIKSQNIQRTTDLPGSIASNVTSKKQVKQVNR